MTLYSDNHEKGDPELGAERIRITPKGMWTPVYWIPVKELNEGEVILSGVNIQLTNCRPSDLTASSDSPCKGTAPYNLNPEIETKIILAKPAADGKKPTLSGPAISPTEKLDCTIKLHHCVPAQYGKLEVGPSETGNRMVTLYVRATDPKAKPCKPAKPKDCNVLQLTHGQGRLGVARERHPNLEPPVSTTERELVDELELAKTKAEKKKFQKVIYSMKLEKTGPVLIRADLLAEFGADYPTPPLVNKQLILADSPTSTEGLTVEPQNGENCQGKCHYIQIGLIPCVTQADLDAGRQYLNLVGFSSRSSAYANPNKGVEIEDGGFLGIRQYDASLAPIACESDD